MLCLFAYLIWFLAQKPRGQGEEKVMFGLPGSVTTIMTMSRHLTIKVCLLPQARLKTMSCLHENIWWFHTYKC